MRLPIGPASIAAAVLVAGCDTGQPPPRDASAATSERAAPAVGSSPERISTEPAAPPAALASAAESTRAGVPDGIEWFAGDIDAAFDAARAANEPVLLYWGAEWCPYCADLEAHVFTREDVQQKLELFVPVYLDGDDPGAQRSADTFGVAGYPTVLALAPDRTELARIAGGMDLTLYAEMLDLVLGDVRPIDDVLRVAEAGTLSADDCRRLAYNGWPLDDAASERTAYLAAALAAAAEGCAGDVERARLTAYAASFALAAESDGASPTAERLVPRIPEIVANRELAVSIADVLRELDETYFEAAKLADPEGADDLLEDWAAAMDAASLDPRYGHGDRLAAIRSKIEAITVLDPAGISAAAAADAHRRIDEAFAQVGRSPARPGTANAAINLLVALGDIDRARAIAEHELEISRTPYYHMADLAWLDEMLGRYDDAVAWLERAYRTSEGAATRFQWGTSYVRGLIRMTPEDEDAVRTAALEVLGELDGPSRLYRRSRARLETLDATLREWNANGEHDEVIGALRGRMAEICGAIPADEADAGESCAAFLSDALAAEDSA